MATNGHNSTIAQSAQSGQSAKAKKGQPAIVDYLIGEQAYLRFVYDPKRGWFEMDNAGLWFRTGKRAPKLFTWIRKLGERCNVTTAPTIQSCLTMLENDPNFLRPDAFDTDDLIVGLPDGRVVDFNTYRNLPIVRPLRSGELVSRRMGATPDRDLFDNMAYQYGCGAPPAWDAFLSEVLPAEEDKRYMQILFGICLLGDTASHTAHLFYGKGRNGKSICLQVLQKLAGDYHSLVDAKALTSSNRDHPTWLAKLYGARLATADDIQPGTWNSSQFKELSAGERMQARYLCQDWFEFKPKCSLVFTGNDMPTIGDKDYAMQARIRIVPFPRAVPEGQRDTGLAKRLLAELPGIAAWALEGAWAYLQFGLSGNTAAMTAQRKKWLGQEIDPVNDWLEKNLTRADGHLLLHDDLKAAMQGALVVRDIRPVIRKLLVSHPYAERGAKSKGKRGVRNVALCGRDDRDDVFAKKSPRSSNDWREQ